ncbi:MAG: hypothetical protein AAF192_18725 [Pseudomonadota bacterium]
MRVRAMARGAAALAAAAVMMGGAAAADPVQAIVQEAAESCRSFNDGVFDAADAVREVDLDGVAPLDRLVDESRFRCSSAASMYCGSGGCGLHAAIGDRAWRWQAEGWRMVDWGLMRVLLVARDGGWCGGVGAQTCVEAVVWSGGEALTMAPPP